MRFDFLARRLPTLRPRAGGSAATSTSSAGFALLGRCGLVRGLGLVRLVGLQSDDRLGFRRRFRVASPGRRLCRLLAHVFHQGLRRRSVVRGRLGFRRKILIQVGDSELFDRCIEQSGSGARNRLLPLRRDLHFGLVRRTGIVDSEIGTEQAVDPVPDLFPRRDHRDEVATDLRTNRILGRYVVGIRRCDDGRSELALDGHHVMGPGHVGREDLACSGIDAVGVEVDEFEVALARQPSNRVDVSHGNLIGSLAA